MNNESNHYEKSEMKIQYCSDLHLEFPENKKFIQDNPIIPNAEVLILAGDIVPFHLMHKFDDFFDYISKHFKFTYWIAGNHEYYGSDIGDRREKFKEEIRENVWLVNNYCAIHDNVKIILSTLWSKIAPENSLIIKNMLNDFRLIKFEGEKLSTTVYNQMFDENMSFIEDEVRNNEEEKCIVVTHHVPTLRNYPKEYVGSSINNAFAVNLDDFISTSNIDYWIYGHHHRNVPKFEIDGTQLLTNQLGYVRANENIHFSVSETIDL